MLLTHLNDEWRKCGDGFGRASELLRRTTRVVEAAQAAAKLQQHLGAACVAFFCGDVEGRLAGVAGFEVGVGAWGEGGEGEGGSWLRRLVVDFRGVAVEFRGVARRIAR